MPYPGEPAGKGGHADFVRNPDVNTFLKSCAYLRQPSEQEAAKIGALFTTAPSSPEPLLPRMVIASDASKSDTPISERLPSTQIGFLKVSHVLVNMEKYAGLVPAGGRFVDPFRAAEIHREAHPVTFTMPGSNVRYKGSKGVKDGFRHALFDHLQRVGSESHRGQTLLKTLRDLEVGHISLSKCPSCQEGISLVFDGAANELSCPLCSAPIYISDSLRLHEGISDFGDNSSAMTRMMNAVEHLMLASFVKQVQIEDVSRLSDLSFVVDGPLAIFGEPAKLSQRLQRLIYQVNEELACRNLRPMLVLGLQKTGGLMDHAKLIEEHIRPGSLRVVDDEYRNQYITGAESPSDNFGNETYYGQDFLFRTESGRIFNFAIPYPFQDKTCAKGGSGFSKAKVESVRYGTLIQQACDLIRHFEMDLYESAIVPVALAHRHASISLSPGGKVLDLMVRAGLK